jgi:hypothetical protein
VLWRVLPLLLSVILTILLIANIGADIYEVAVGGFSSSNTASNATATNATAAILV